MWLKYSSHSLASLNFIRLPNHGNDTTTLSVAQTKSVGIVFISSPPLALSASALHFFPPKYFQYLSFLSPPLLPSPSKFIASFTLTIAKRLLIMLSASSLALSPKIHLPHFCQDYLFDIISSLKPPMSSQLI